MDELGRAFLGRAALVSVLPVGVHDVFVGRALERTIAGMDSVGSPALAYLARPKNPRGPEMTVLS